MWIYSELPGSGATASSQGDKATKYDEATVSKSPSDYGLLGRRTGAVNSRRTQSHSGGNAPVRSDKRHPVSSARDFTDLHGVDAQMFDVVVSLVDTLLTLDCRVDTWRSLMSSSWRRIIDVGRNKKQRQHLKSKFFTLYTIWVLRRFNSVCHMTLKTSTPAEKILLNNPQSQFHSSKIFLGGHGLTCCDHKSYAKPY